jgi:hypothetical protein
LGGTKPYGFLYGAAQTSHTARTLGDMGKISIEKYTQKIMKINKIDVEKP